MAAETVIQLRRGLAATWVSTNPVLEMGELGFETDTRKIKVGDGVTAWTGLNYIVKQVDNLLLGSNTISATNLNGDILLSPNGTGMVKVVGVNLVVDGDIYSQTSKKIATEEYVDAVRQGLDVKDSVRVATTANITLSGLQTIDGVTLSAGQRVLVKNQDLPSENGIYVASAGVWPRGSDSNTNSNVTAGMFTFVEEGSVNANSGWVLITAGSITPGSTPLSFTQFSGAGQISAGAGLTKNGNQLDVGGTAGRITVNADSIDIASDYVGQNTITTVGEITTGTWKASTVEAAYGGTGISTYAVGDMIYASGTSTLSRLAAGQASYFMRMNSTGTAPEWSNVINGGTP